MGDRNQLRFGQRHLRLFRAPCLEIGSRDGGHTVSFRDALAAPAGDYLGVDMEPGPGVDVVLDLTGDFSLVSRRLPVPFATIFCLSVLEHCRQPFRMAETIRRLLAPGGVLFVSVPFAWEIHRFPDDYWRFTPEAVRLLFPDIEFPPAQCAYHSQVEDAFHALAEGPPRLGRALNDGSRKRRVPVFRGMSALLGRSRLVCRALPYDYLFPPVMIDMIGHKGRMR
jgi:SAM-dependent methyltransferase